MIKKHSIITEIMKIITKLFFLVLIIMLPFCLLAQTVVSAVNGINWRLMPTWQEGSLMGVSAYNSSGSPACDGMSTGIARIDDNSIASSIQIGADNYGVIRLNSDLSSKWLTPVDGYPIAISLYKGNVLVIAATELSSYKNINNIYKGFLIDAKTGQILISKEIYHGSDKFYEQPVFMFSPDGTFFKLAVRTSNFTRTMHNPLLMFKLNDVAQDYFTSNDFNLFEFDDNLNVKSSIKPILEDGYFIGGTTNKNGDVFFMTDYSNGIIKIAKYESGKTKATKVLQLPVSMDDEIFHNLDDNFLYTSKTDPSVLFFAGDYVNGPKDRELVVAKFNFRDGSVSHNTQVIDKGYLKDLEKSYIPYSKKYNSVDLGPKNEMKIRNMIESDGKLIIGLSSFGIRQNDPKEQASIVAYDLLINIYDDKTNLQYQQIIPRSYTSVAITRLGMGFYCKNNMLYVVANNNKGIYGYKALYGQIDLNDGSIKNITGIEKGDIKRSYAVDPYAGFWFDKQFVLSYMEEKGVLWYKSEDAHLQLLSY
jgi:hypothetical protein